MITKSRLVLLLCLVCGGCGDDDSTDDGAAGAAASAGQTAGTGGSDAAGAAAAGAAGTNDAGAANDDAGATMIWPGPGAVAPAYDDARFWLCGPGAEDDLCSSQDLTVTEVRADGSFVSVPHVAASAPEVDCFYVYPTVDLRFEEDNTTDFTDISMIVGKVLAHAAPFTSTCRVFAPLYRQMAIGTYVFASDYEATDSFAMAYGDVTAAFDHYMANHNDGRGIVLIGHSQGSHMLTKLLEDRFDDDDALRSQLVSALLTGPTGRVYVPPGEVAGGNFDNLPLCEAEDQTACVITFDSEAAGGSGERVDPKEIPAGMERACTNPASLAGGAGTLAATVWSTASDMEFPPEVVDPWVSFPGLHTAECGATAAALEIDVVADDPRMAATPQQLQLAYEEIGFFALHEADVNYTIGDLLRIVAAQSAAYQP